MVDRLQVREVRDKGAVVEDRGCGPDLRQFLGRTEEAGVLVVGRWAAHLFLCPTVGTATTCSAMPRR